GRRDGQPVAVAVHAVGRRGGRRLRRRRPRRRPRRGVRGRGRRRSLARRRARQEGALMAAERPSARAGSGGTPPKNARRRSRELAMQGLYQWLLSGEDAGAIEAHVAASTPGYEKADHDYFKALLHGTLEAAAE